MSMTAMVNPDAGARMVSSSVAVSETAPAGAHPTFTLIEPAAGRAVLGFGDGTLRSVALDGSPALATLVRLPATPLAADVDIGGDAVLIGTDGGHIYRLAGDTAKEFCHLGSAWVGSVAVHRGAGLRAFAAGKTVLVLDRDGAEILNSDDHPSTVMGLSYSPNGRYIAAAHYGGVTVRNLAEPEQEKISLSWHGSHTAVAWSPCGRLIVTAMQDKEMHCWRWNDRTGLRMSGYPSKIRCISWTADGHYIAASGADTVTSWDCRGKGPTGKPPLEFGYVYNGVVMQVAAHPSDLVVAGGYSDGTVLIGNIEQESAMIARAGTGSAIAGLAWAPDGQTLVASDEAGTVAVIHVKDAIA